MNCSRIVVSESVSEVTRKGWLVEDSPSQYFSPFVRRTTCTAMLGFDKSSGTFFDEVPVK